MCEYIILEDFKMDKYIYDDKNGLWHELQGDYYIPCLGLLTEKENLSVYGGNDIYITLKSISGLFILT